MDQGTPESFCEICGHTATVGRWCWEHYVRWLLTTDPNGEPPKLLFPPCEPGESWLPAPDYEENYLVSNRGRIWSRPRYKTPGGIMKLQVGRYDYWQVGLTAVDGTQKTHRVHVLEMRAFDPEGWFPGALVRHLNGDPSDNRYPENICWGTYEENAQDIVEHGRNRNINKTHCPRGHEYNEANTYINPTTGGRYCRTCQRIHVREAQRRYQARQRAAGKQCSHNGCTNLPVAKGLCHTHRRWQIKAQERAVIRSATIR
jgi:hypothetical protein